MTRTNWGDSNSVVVTAVLPTNPKILSIFKYVYANLAPPTATSRCSQLSSRKKLTNSCFTTAFEYDDDLMMMMMMIMMMMMMVMTVMMMNYDDDGDDGDDDER